VHPVYRGYLAAYHDLIILQIPNLIWRVGVSIMSCYSYSRDSQRFNHLYFYNLWIRWYYTVICMEQLIIKWFDSTNIGIYYFSVMNIYELRWTIHQPVHHKRLWSFYYHYVQLQRNNILFHYSYVLIFQERY